MSGRLWLKYFIDSLKEKSEADYPTNPDGDLQWTDFMYKVMDGVADKLNCKVARLRSNDSSERGEYLTIDCFFIGKEDYDPEKKYEEFPPFVLPRAVVEIENWKRDSYQKENINIVYCLWKTLCIRSPIRVLVCYEKGMDKVTNLAKRLENVIWNESLMKGDGGDLLVIIGDEEVEESTPWGKYLHVFEWRGDKLDKVEGINW